MTESSAASGAPARADGAPVVRWLIRGTGLVVLLLTFLPLHRLMQGGAGAPRIRASIEGSAVSLEVAVWGTSIVLVLAGLLARFLPATRLRLASGIVVGRLRRLPERRFTVGVSGLALAASWLAGRMVHQGHFTNVDEIASTVHARYLAAGSLGGPTFGLPEFWLIPNTVIGPEGWVSHFPPTHLVTLGLFEWLGVPRLVGPVFLAILVGFTALSLRRLLPDRPGARRVTALLLALSPLVVSLGAGALSHVTAGAWAAVLLYCALRARDGSAWWALPAGAAMGLLVSDRPYIGLVLGAIFTLGVWMPGRSGASRIGPAAWGRRLAGAVVGGLPFAVLLGAYNRALFGAPLRLGYLEAFGDRHRLGFHRDPWGVDYGLAEGIALAGSDLRTFGLQLLETPIPLTALVGVYLLWRAPRFRGVPVVVAWAVVPVVAHVFYWFHDARLLFESGPAWLALTALAVADLASGSDRRPARQPLDAERDSAVGEGGDPHGGRRLGTIRGWAADTVAWATALALLWAVGVGAPGRWSAQRWSPETLARITAPEPGGPDPSLVLVHTSWNERTGAILQGVGGMRQDSVLGVQSRNSSCALHAYALAREAVALRPGSPGSLPPIDRLQAALPVPDLVRPRAPSGAAFRVREGEVASADCRRELHADRFGALSLVPLLWQGDLPGIERGRPVFARDLGPERNRALLDRYPDREPWVFTFDGSGATPVLMPYRDAMILLWDESADDLSSAAGR